MRNFERIRDTSPLSLKSLTSQLQMLFFRVRNITGKDIRENEITIGHVVDGFGTGINISENEIIIQATESINQRVKTGDFESYQTQTAEQISSRVKTEDFSSYRTQTAQEISSRVEKGKIISEINHTAEIIKIQANKINLVGAVTVLSDISGNLGAITAGTITGVTLKSVSGSNRIEITGTQFASYEGSSVSVKITGRKVEFYDYASNYGLRGKIFSSNISTGERGFTVAGANDYLTLGGWDESSSPVSLIVDLSNYKGGGLGAMYLSNKLFTQGHLVDDNYLTTGNYWASKLFASTVYSTNGAWVTVNISDTKFSSVTGCVTSNMSGQETKYRNLTKTSVDVCISGTGSGNVDFIVFGTR